MEKTNIEKGKEGEELAIAFLEKKGFQILDRNWRFHHLELDIIAQLKKQIIIVEVKTRFGNLIHPPEFAVTPAKQNLIISATNAYVKINKIDKDVRFDIISITFAGWEHKIDHIEDAFYPRVKKIY